MEYCAAEKTAIPLFAATHMDLEDIMLNENSCTGQQICDFLYMWMLELTTQLQGPGGWREGWREDSEWVQGCSGKSKS